MRFFMRLLAVLALTGFLAACAGGGGGGGSSSSSGGTTITPFTSWSALTANSTVQALGGSTISSVATGNTQSITGGSFLGTYGSDGDLSSFTLGASDGSSANFNKNSGSTFTYSGDTIIAVNNTNSNVAVLVDPNVAGWNYQSYGVWVNTSPASVAAVSVGSPTVGSSIPTTSSATFTGGAGGVYYDGSASYVTAANMTASVNFATRQIGFATTSTAKTNLSTGVTSSATSQNLSGTLSYSAGSNNISGNLTSTGGMSGTAVGQFYGPSANEIGGTYKVNSGSSYMIGGFGGKR